MSGERGWIRRQWRTIAIFVLLAPILALVVVMATAQFAQEAGFSFARLGSWIVEERLFAVRVAYILGVLPALVAGLLVARRDALERPSVIFVVGLAIIIALPFAYVFAHIVYIFTPPPIDEQFKTGGEIVLGVVAAGLVCYAVSRWLKR